MSEHILDPYDPTVYKVHKALKLAVSSGAAPELIETLESALELVSLREDFADKATSEQSRSLKKIQEETKRHDWAKVHQEGKSSWKLLPSMLIGPLQGQFLKSLVSIQKPKRILEIGMLTGYSALVMAEALPADGELVSVDMEEYLKTLVTDLIKDSPHCKKIKIIIGKALDVLTDMVKRGEKFDLIFMDAEMSDYLTYIKYAFEDGLLNPGGTVLVDNAFIYGQAYIPSSEDTAAKNSHAFDDDLLDSGDTLREDSHYIYGLHYKASSGFTAAKNFLSTVSADPSLHKVLVPLRDGLLMIRRLSDVEGSTK